MADSDNSSRKPVITYDLGSIVGNDISEEGPTHLTSDWLCPEMLKELISSVKGAYEQQINGLSNTTLQQLKIKCPKALSVGARKALLSKYAVPDSSDYDTAAVTGIWGVTAVESLIQEGTPEQWEELMELFRNAKSNGRPLKWTLMDICPGTRFKLHAHPNIELVYCLAGELHEVRMEGDPITKSFPLNEKGVQGPNIQDCSRPWSFGTLSAGNWLVNEVGSIHKSFADAKGCCVLLALWSEHADIARHNEPKAFNVDAVIEKCCADENAVRVGETFLPESERSC